MEADASAASRADDSTSPAGGKLTAGERAQIRAAAIARARILVSVLEANASRQWNHVHRLRDQLQAAEAFLNGAALDLRNAREALAIAEGKAKPKFDFRGEEHAPCLWCGKELERRVSPAGDVESIDKFHGRKYCSPSCSRHGVAEQKRNAREAERLGGGA